MLNHFSKYCPQSTLSNLCTDFIRLSQQALNVKNGNVAKWEAAIAQIKMQNITGVLRFDAPYLKIDTPNFDTNALKQPLKQLMPWRKGPYQINTLKLDSEWRGDMKWARLATHISPLKDKTVLDVGCGNGYFTYKMAMAGAQFALGIEPFLLFNYQFQAIRLMINNPPNAFVLPLRLADIPNNARFDSIFSMGVLYHQKDPIQHLQQLKNALQRGGELILESLIIDKKHGSQIIVPRRYAKMRNVYCLPSVDTLRAWLLGVGFQQIKCIDITKTTPEEQHTTHWIGDKAQSLKDFLDPNNINLTIEGLPAPKRVIFICKK